MNQQTNAAGRRQITTAGILNIIAGIWILISPWVYGYAVDTGGMWNSVIVGIVIAVLALIRASGAYTQAWLSWINAILGLWLIISPWVYGYDNNTGGSWNSIILGIIVCILAVWSAQASRSSRQERH
jgi:hypothetical protein